VNTEDAQPPTPRHWTVTKILLAILLAASSGALGGLFFLAYRGDFRAPPLNPLVATVKVPKRFSLGSPMIIEFELFNRSPKPVPIADRGESGKTARNAKKQERAEEYDVLLLLLGSTLPLADPLGFKQVTVLGIPPDLILLNPGAKKAWPIDITQYAVIDKKGRYKLTVSRHPYVDKVRVHAKTVTIIVD
jgi:hypothetical protein